MRELTREAIARVGRVGRRFAGAGIGAPVTRRAWELSDEDRRYLVTPYDDHVALPPGASEYLRPNNGRLLDLRAAYESMDVPAAQHSQWTPSNVQEYVDLRHFRGDTMIQWQYRELPRATQLKWFIYVRYLQAKDTRGLLGTLGEDGLFGCWTYDFAGHPTVSRDLLESVNELLFLDRQLSLLDQPSLRVLDIGAGYGRFAHRLTGAVPGLVDCCCVDAVPESTFLCEYYLRFRGCTPPARVLPLNNLDALHSDAFDLAVNIHSFSECTRAAVSWWMEQLVDWGVPLLFVVPNEPDGFLSRELDSSRCDLMPVLERAGFRLRTRAPVIDDPAVRAMLRIEDHFHLFELAPAAP